MSLLTVKDKQFYLDGEPLHILSGAIHYFRVVPEYWKDRLLKLKACGFNTVETYIAWNFHEPEEGKFRFDHMADVAGFIRLAGELGLHVIVRPSPYICAEWEFGGLPAWLLKDSNIRLRCCDPLFLEKVDAYYDVLIPILVPLLSTNGGPIIAVQIENEYGSYGNDSNYLEHLKNGLIERGVDVLLFTSDGPEDSMLQGGTLPDVTATVNFGSRADDAFMKLRQYRSDDPLVCMEFWNGWFDHWMEQHHTRDAQDVANVFEDMLKAGASVNFFMFHGGTNFGFYNGANHGERYEPTVTSYDYDCLLTEWGTPTQKFTLVREVMARYADIGHTELPQPIPIKRYGDVKLAQSAGLFDQLDRLSNPVRRTCPEPMEKVGQNYGFILYSTHVSGPRGGAQLTLQDVHDRALVFIDGAYIGTVERWKPQPLTVKIPAGGARLDILVENMGRVNYGPYLKDYKGITEGVRLNNQFLFDWTIYPLPLTDLGGLQFSAAEDGGQYTAVGAKPAFYKGTIGIDETADTFIRLDGWTKGVVYVNGFNLGRYWNVGPQKTLYVPAPLLRKGENEIIVFELHGNTAHDTVVLTDAPEL
ncbi:glycoside hydrolase family 35 protein [Paenibacillus thermotolerans]|uniref:glycoside hydrolase family 35 protein n=1 Tax=Paenibacillus thermotolerans TaxID=3027807 RepID=UPI002368AC5F|nr:MULTISPECIES: beta-galactosidase family protein [unclassified Paenibacillus]